eukprot:m.218832 g.218832  ORF g.218832 m.218832 type:complete len:376 (-) comp18689_c0_seq6:884-2011(-)
MARLGRWGVGTLGRWRWAHSGRGGYVVGLRLVRFCLKINMPCTIPKGFKLHLVNVVTKGEKSVAGDGHVGKSGGPFGALGCRQRLRCGFKVFKPDFVLVLGHVVVDVRHTRVDPRRTLDTILERQGQDLGVKACMPRVDLAACQLDAVHAALLSSTNARNLPTLCVAHRVGLCVLDGDGGNDEVPLGLRGDGCFCHDVVQQCLGDLSVVSLLAKSDTKNLLKLVLRWSVRLVSLENQVLASFLFLQDFQGFRLVVVGNDTVADLAAEDLRCRHVHGAADGGKVPKARHGIGVAGTHVRHGLLRESLALDLVGLFQLGRQRHKYSCTSGADVLERGCRRQTSGRVEFDDELPSVESIHKVGVAGRSVEHLKRHAVP